MPKVKKNMHPTSVTSLQSIQRISIVAFMAACIACGSYFHITFGPAPITLQDMLIVIAALLLGPRYGTYTVAVYLLAGCIGLPVFHGGKGGIGHILGPTGGYLLGFLPLAFCAGMGGQLALRITQLSRGIVAFRSRQFFIYLGVVIIACLLGMVCLYTAGSLWLAWRLSLPLEQAIAVGVLPFLPIVVPKMIVACFFSFIIHKKSNLSLLFHTALTKPQTYSTSTQTEPANTQSDSASAQIDSVSKQADSTKVQATTANAQVAANKAQATANSIQAQRSNQLGSINNQATSVRTDSALTVSKAAHPCSFAPHIPLADTNSPIVQAQKIGYAYSSHHKPIWSNLSFDLAAGNALCISGINGSGKSTLLHMLASLFPPSHGELVLHNINAQLLCQPNYAEQRKQTALLLQDADMQILGATVGEDMLIGASTSTISAYEFEQQAKGIAAQFSLLAQWDTPVQHLSYGQKRKLCIATALLHQPRLLLLDEPLSGLDYPACLELIDIIKHLLTLNTAIIITSHELDLFVPFASSFLFLHPNLPPCFGSGKELVNQCASYQIKPFTPQ